VLRPDVAVPDVRLPDCDGVSVPSPGCASLWSIWRSQSIAGDADVVAWVLMKLTALRSYSVSPALADGSDGAPVRQAGRQEWA
jgi:hypothetical protein